MNKTEKINKPLKSNLEINYCYYLKVLSEQEEPHKNAFLQGNLHGIGYALGYTFKSIEKDITRAICEPSHLALKI